MPWDPSDPKDPNNFHLGKDHYNRLHLPELEQQTQADVDRMQHSLDELMGEPTLTTARSTPCSRSWRRPETTCRATKPWKRT